MRFCVYCRANVSDVVGIINLSCPTCATKVVRYCPIDGTKIGADEIFCGPCKAKREQCGCGTVNPHNTRSARNTLGTVDIKMCDDCFPVCPEPTAVAFHDILYMPDTKGRGVAIGALVIKRRRIG